MTNIFNSTFEVSLRVVLLLNKYDGEDLTCNMIKNIDFICTYGKDFKLTKSNLQGDNMFKLTQLPMRTHLIEESLKRLIHKGLVTLNFSEKGFVYNITEKGRIYSSSFTSDYAKKYEKLVCKVKKITKNKSEEEIANLLKNNYPFLKEEK